MKKIMVVLLGLIILGLCACGGPGGSVLVTTQPAQTEETADSGETATAEPAQPDQEPLPSVSASPASDDAPEMYTSYAHMTAFNLSDNTAAFDYFDLLKGDDAVKWLVDHEGYSQTDAQALVSEFADSEFVEKNTNPQLRMIDLSAVPVYLVVNDDGVLTDTFEPHLVSIDTLRAMASSDPDLLLKPFFYEVKVSDSGEVESVNQVYWP